ncbi:MAG: hypothetical protein AB9891_01365 [Anaerolineaceae bacterium]
MKIAKIIAVLGLMVMTAGILYALTVGDFAVDGAAILANPWGIVSMVDLYTGFILFSMWIVYREKAFSAFVDMDRADDDPGFLDRRALHSRGYFHIRRRLAQILDGKTNLSLTLPFREGLG